MPRLARNFLLLFALAAGAARAAPSLPQSLADMDQVDIYLLTAGRGADIAALFGHTILRVVDRKQHLDLNFNWGSFDFQDPAFPWKFYVGDLRYFVEALDFATLVEGYARYEHRGFYQDHLSLTAAQKQTLLRRIGWNMRPENVYYQYQQVKDNCSTKPRDYLDEALGGAIRRAYAGAAGRLPYRAYIRDGAREFWWADIGMDMLLNASYDAPISQWDEMFLPAKLREHLLTLPAVGDDGRPIPGKNLLDGSEILVDLPEPFARRDPYFALGLIMVVPVALLWLARAPFAALSGPLWVRAAGLVATLFGLWSGLFGLSMTTNWLISRYAETWANANLWLMWPVDFIFAAWGLRALFSGRPGAAGTRLARCVRSLSWLHLGGLLVLAVGSATALIHQNVAPILATTGLAGLLLYALLARRVA